MLLVIIKIRWLSLEGKLATKADNLLKEGSMRRMTGGVLKTSAGLELAKDRLMRQRTLGVLREA